MATIEEIEQHDTLIRASEAKALGNLASHLREAVIELPVDSQLARAFVRRSKTFEEAGRQRDIRGDGELWMLTRDVDQITQELRSGQRQNILAAIAAAMLAGADQLDAGPLKQALEREAGTLRRSAA